MDQPKLITLQAPTVSTQRTLIWLQTQDPSVPWNRWSGVVVGREAYRHWKAAGANILCLIELDAATDDDFAELYDAAKVVSLVLVSQSVLVHKSQEFWTENFDNVMNLNVVHESYPFLGEAWMGTAEDAVLLCAWLCRYHRLIDGPLKVPESRQHPEITFVWGQRPPECWLFTQFFVPGTKPRQKEIKHCLRRNLECPWVDRVVLLNEKDESAAWASFPNREKIQQVVIGRRLRYGDFLRYVQSANVPSNTIVALCNADIYLDEETRDLWKIKLEDRMLALLRWDDAGQGPRAPTTKLFGPRADSQDTWIFLSDSIKERAWNDSDVDFMLGQPGCDNAFAGVMLRNRFLITNPALSLKTYHVHNTNLRTYNKSDYIRSPLYINLVPTYLIDTRQEIVPKGSGLPCICNELVSFEVKSSSLSNEITYCTMLEKEGRYKWEPQVENHEFEPAIPVYRWKDAGVTSNGLVYNLYSIFTGRHALASSSQEETRYNYWKEANVDIFAPLLSVDRMLAIPLPKEDAVFDRYDRYVTYYLSRALRLLRDYPGASLWVPSEFMSSVTAQFSCNPAQFVPYDESTGCWAKEVIGFLPGPSTAEIAHEDVEELRRAWPDYLAGPIQKKCVVIVDDVWTEAFARESLTRLTKGEWIIETTPVFAVDDYHPFRGASLCICFGGKDRRGASTRAWALPRGAKVIEFQQELKLDGESQHLFHMSDLQAWVMLLSKGTMVDVQDQIAAQLRKWWVKQFPSA